MATYAAQKSQITYSAIRTTDSHLVFHHLFSRIIFFLWLERNLDDPKPHTCFCYLFTPANNTHGYICNLTNIAYRKNCNTIITSHTTVLSSFTYSFTHKTVNIELKNHKLYKTNAHKYLYVNRTNKQKQQWKKAKETKTQDNNTSFYTVSEWEHFINVNGIYASDNTPLSMLFTMKRSVI